ncbi:DUF5817 domain-containing protein [Halobaculum sp. MBLA0147]|uniref:DUF5817 domain-containing protein n=1 Tax=Halobaculum sp. MBLA0147 TaxID=3079934 RepID=UPI003526736C
MNGPVQAAVGGRIAVVGCADCQHYWLIEHSDIALQDTLTCPRCARTHATDAMRTLAEADTREQAAELRSRILASRADRLESYEREGTYAEQGAQIDLDDSLGPDVDHPATTVPKSIVDDDVGGLFRDWFDHDWKAGIHDDRLADAAADVEITAGLSVDDETLADPWSDAGVDPAAGELAYDTQHPVDHVDAVTLTPDTTATSLWTTLLDGVGEQLLTDAISRLRAEYDHTESHTLARRLKEIGVPASLWSVVEAAVRDDAHVDEVLKLARRIATQRQPVERLYGLAHLLGWRPGSDPTPETLVVRATDQYIQALRDGDRATDTVDNIARLLEHLGHSLEVIVVASPVDCRLLTHLHDHHNVTRRWTGRQSHTDIDAVAHQAIIDYGRDATEIDILRTLAHNDTRGLSYRTLADDLDVSRQRLSQIIPETDDADADRLEGRDLVTTLRVGNRTQVEITPYGCRVVEILAERDREQTTLDEAVSRPLRSPSHGREAPREHEEEEDSDPRRKGCGLAQVQQLASWRAAQALSACTPQGISVVDASLDSTDDCREADLWVDTQEDAVVVSCEYTNPMQWTLSTARALSNSRTLKAFLTQEQATTTDLGELFADHRQVLRSSTCLGHLPDRLDDLNEFIASLQEARDDLQELSGDLHDAKAQDDESEVSRLYSQITREALGLSSTIIAVLDLLDVEIVREVRVPGFNREFDAARWEDLTQMIGTASAIQSRQGLNTLYRQLYEPRESKQEWTVDIDDAATGLGELMGSWVICGDFGSHGSDKRKAFVEDLRATVAEPRPLREDAPEFGAEIPVNAFDSDRVAVRRAARRLCERKGYDEPSAAVVSVLQLYTGGAYDTARCLNYLQPADGVREELDVRELRYAISHLDTSRIVPTESSAVGRVIRELLRSDAPLSTQELADAADVARSTLTRDGGAGDRLRGLGLLKRTDDGEWRILLPTDQQEERDGILPSLLVDETITAVRDVLGDVAFQCVSDPARLADPDDPVTSPWLWDQTDGPDCRPLLEAWEWLRPWVPILVDILDHEPDWWTETDGPDHALLGVDPSQARLDSGLTTVG